MPSLLRKLGQYLVERTEPAPRPVYPPGWCQDCGGVLADGHGLVSPESDEIRNIALQGRPAQEAIERAVCVACYRAAFRRVYPGERCPV